MSMYLEKIVYLIFIVLLEMLENCMFKQFFSFFAIYKISETVVATCIFLHNSITFHFPINLHDKHS